MSKKREKSYCNVPRYPPDWPFWRIQTLTWDGWSTNPDLGMKRGCSRKTSFRCHQFDPKIRFEPAPFPLWAPPINLQLGRTSLNWDTYIHTYIPTYLPTYLHTYLPYFIVTSQRGGNGRSKAGSFLVLQNPLLFLYCVVVLFRLFSISCFTSFHECAIHNIKIGVRQIVLYSCGPGTDLVRGAPRSLTVFSVQTM